MLKRHIDFDMRAISGKWLSESATVALGIFLLTLLTWKKFEIQEMQLVKPRIEIQVEEIPPTEQINEAPPPERPSIPIESEDEDVPEDVTIESTTIDFEEAPPPPPAAEEDEVPEFVPYDKPPQATKQVQPKYPEIARKAGIEGIVILRFVIDLEGKVVEKTIKVQKNTTGNSGCVEAAMEALKQYQFTPAMQRDKPVKVWISLPFRFSLNK